MLKPLISRPRLLLVLAVLALGCGQAHAQAEVRSASAGALPAVQRSGAIEYLSGGIGSDESQAIEAASRQWPLSLQFAVQGTQGADYAADVQVELKDARGGVLLQARAAGPFMLLRLAPGRYVVDASFGGKRLSEPVLVKAGQPARARFTWPAGTGQ